MTCAGLANDGHYRAFAHGGKKFRDDAHQRTHHQTQRNSAEHMHTGEFKPTDIKIALRQNKITEEITGNKGKYHRTPVAHVQCFLNNCSTNTCSFTNANEKCSNNRENDTG